MVSNIEQVSFINNKYAGLLIGVDNICSDNCELTSISALQIIEPNQEKEPSISAQHAEVLDHIFALVFY